MPRPRIIDWASNANHPAGANPWNGQPTKVEPAAGRIAGGFEPETAAAPEHVNWLLNNNAQNLDWLAPVQVGSWQPSSECPLTGVTGATWVGVAPAQFAPRAICFDPTTGEPSAINAIGYTIVGSDGGVPGIPYPPGGAGTSWRDEVTNPSAVFVAAGTYVDMDADAGGGRVACSDTAANVVAQSAAIDAAWALTVPATVGAVWGHVVHDPGLGLWALGGSLGEIDTSPDRANWTARASGLAAAQITAMAARKDPVGGLATRFVAFTAAEVTTSPDGINWAAAVHGLGGPITPTALAHDALTGRWLVTTDIGGATAYSDDGGATWAWTGNRIGSPSPLTPHQIRLASDQMGHFVATIDTDPGGFNPSAVLMYHTRNGGAAWSRVHFPSTHAYGGALTHRAPWGAGIVYCAGRWVTVGADGVDFAGLHSLQILP